MTKDSIIDAIGDTPLVALSKISAGHPGLICAKLESLNPGGSHKARIAKAMIEAAERNGELERGAGNTIVEATGGNTGMGLAIAGAHLGYNVVLVVPNTYSEEKRRRLQRMGAQVETVDYAGEKNPHGKRALELYLENEGWVMLNQATNPANPEMHRRTTAREILAAVPAAEIRFLVAGIGTGGHITGVGEILKQESDAIEVVGVQPEGCCTLDDVFVPHKIQGIAVGLLPPVLNHEVVDEMFTVTEREAIEGARELMSVEGISAGLSSGANLVAAKALLPRCEEGERVVTFVYDCADDYVELT